MSISFLSTATPQQYHVIAECVSTHRTVSCADTSDSTVSNPPQSRDVASPASAQHQNPPGLSSLTRALAVLHVGLQLPTLVARTLHAELVLFAALAAL